MSNHLSKRPVAKVATLKGRCTTGKIRFRDRQEAIAALHRAENNRSTAALAGQVTRRREVRCYRCPSCRGVHLSSLPTWTDIKKAA